MLVRFVLAEPKLAVGDKLAEAHVLLGCQIVGC